MTTHTVFVVSLVEYHRCSECSTAKSAVARCFFSEAGAKRYVKERKEALKASHGADSSFDYEIEEIEME
jgi:hypothetical protein